MPPRIPHHLDNGQSPDTTTPSAQPSPSLIAYVVAVQGTNVTYLHCSSSEPFLARCSAVPPDFASGKLFCLSWSHADPEFKPLLPHAVGSYLNRGDFSFTGSRFDSVVLKSLILGCRIRDFEQHCGIVTQRVPLVIKIPTSYDERNRPRIERFFTDTGEAIDVQVDNYSRSYDGKSSVLCCSPVSTLPGGLAKNSRLHQADTGDGPTLITTALEKFTRFDCDIVNRPLLDRIYGDEGSFDYAPVEQELVTMKRWDGDYKLSADRSEAVWRYNSEGPGFVVQEASGPGRLMTIAGMVMHYTGPGLQLIISTGNGAAFAMAKSLAEIKTGNRKIGHLVAEDKINNYKKMQSPFIMTEEVQDVSLDKRLSLTKPELRTRHAAAAAQRNDYDIIIATANKLLSVILQERVAGAPCPLQELLLSQVRRIVINEGNRMTEAALIALILLFPLAKIVVVGHPEDPKPWKCSRGDVGSELAARPAFEVFMKKKNLPCIKIRTPYIQQPSRPRYRNVPPTLHRSVYSNSNYEHYALLSSLNQQFGHRAAQPRVAPAPPRVNAPNPTPFSLSNVRNRIAPYCTNLGDSTRRLSEIFNGETVATIKFIADKLGRYANQTVNVVVYNERLELMELKLSSLKTQPRVDLVEAKVISPTTEALFSSKSSLDVKEPALIILGRELSVTLLPGSSS